MEPISMAIMATAGLVSNAYGAYKANKMAVEQGALQDKLANEIAYLEQNAKEIPDYASMVRDRSGMIQNQMANLQVATQAAEFQAEEADIALANTLATTRQAGLGAGGATSLAQAALRSKRGISASIEQQEARNIMLRAQGAERAQQARLAEGARVDRLTMTGEQLAFSQEEARRMAMLDYRTDRMTAAEDRQAMAMQRRDQMIGSALGNTAGALMGFGAFGAQAQAGMGSSSGVATLPPMPSRTFNPNTNLNYLDYMGRNK
jgi:hypothetical protein